MLKIRNSTQMMFSSASNFRQKHLFFSKKQKTPKEESASTVKETKWGLTVANSVMAIKYKGYKYMNTLKY